MSLYVFKKYVEECLDKDIEPTFEGFKLYINKNK